MRLIWYLLRTDEGREESLMAACRNHFSADLLHEAFTFSYEKMMRYGGAWHMVRKPMFPGYVFLETFAPESFIKAVRQYEPVLKLLKNGEEALAVANEEERFLNMFCAEDHLLRMSFGIVKDGRFSLEKGPLKGHEELICKVDRHKRLALVKFHAGEKERIITVGLELRERIVTSAKDVTGERLMAGR